MNDNICIVFSEWRQQAAGPMSFEEMLNRPTEANTRTATFQDETSALIFKRAVEQGELVPNVWGQAGAQEV